MKTLYWSYFGLEALNSTSKSWILTWLQSVSSCKSIFIVFTLCKAKIVLKWYLKISNSDFNSKTLITWRPKIFGFVIFQVFWLKVQHLRFENWLENQQRVSKHENYYMPEICLWTQFLEFSGQFQDLEIGLWLDLKTFKLYYLKSNIWPFKCNLEHKNEY